MFPISGCSAVWEAKSGVEIAASPSSLQCGDMSISVRSANTATHSHMYISELDPFTASSNH